MADAPRTLDWNASLSPPRDKVTASGLTYNASISPGGSQTVGFQGSCSGVFAAPGGRAGRSGLTGTVCTVS
ncbi:cellulose binding domain-containing protein [Streptomyces europaeiscabiei]|uniref:cellulose binding domain-containing protein n=1 Tax=Streptomyces europaeiscabiei TaxID=146819 RepID=UPI000E693BC6|nr:cellulose binding domain-containing protein [Streptomyces europaeiscabiei]